MDEEKGDTISRALLKAAEIVGGITALHLYLNVDRSQLFSWIVGKDVPPERTFHRVVELLIDPRVADTARIEQGAPGNEGGKAPPP